MLLSFPALCLVLLAYVHFTVEFAPYSIRKHRVKYRPIRTSLADWWLIARLAFMCFFVRLGRTLDEEGG